MMIKGVGWLGHNPWLTWALLGREQARSPTRMLTWERARDRAPRLVLGTPGLHFNDFVELSVIY